MKPCVSFSTLALLLSITLAGCEPPKPTASAGPPAPPGSAPAPPPTADAAAPVSTGQAPLPIETKFGAFAGTVDDLAARPNSPPPPQAAAQPADPNMERVKAQQGVGIRGRSLDPYAGAVVTPVKAFFAAKERIAFEQAFYGQYRLYRATEDPPKDFADLKAKVLDPYLIKLPLLPQGHKYVWDVATEELQVERPKQQ
jgi:hypothetical protein